MEMNPTETASNTIDISVSVFIITVNDFEIERL